MKKYAILAVLTCLLSAGNAYSQETTIDETEIKMDYAQKIQDNTVGEVKQDKSIVVEIPTLEMESTAVKNEQTELKDVNNTQSAPEAIKEVIQTLPPQKEAINNAQEQSADIQEASENEAVKQIQDVGENAQLTPAQEIQNADENTQITPAQEIQPKTNNLFLKIKNKFPKKQKA